MNANRQVALASLLSFEIRFAGPSLLLIPSAPKQSPKLNPAKSGERGWFEPAQIRPSRKPRAREGNTKAIEGFRSAHAVSATTKGGTARFTNHES